ncbi:MAG: lysylphosphatidylglycerol synthase domain-containing protein [Myxococcota bacterium]
MTEALPAPTRPWLRRAWWVTRVGLVLTGLVVLAWAVDRERLEHVARELPVHLLVGMLLCGTAARLFGVLRWRVSCGGLMAAPPGVPALFRVELLAEFVNIWVPTFIGGEVVRIWGVRDPDDPMPAVWSVAVDRLLGLLGLVLAVIPVVLLVDLPLPGWLVWAGLGGVGAVLGVGFVLRPHLVGLGPWAAALAGLRIPRVFGALALSVASPWCLVLAYWGFFGTVYPSLSLAGVAAFVLLSRFGRAVPVQLLGLNSVEGAMWVLGELFGIPREILALSLATNYGDKLLHSLAGGVVELSVNGADMLQRVLAAGRGPR